MARLCSIRNCERPHIARGYCKRHWNAWHRHGDASRAPDISAPPGMRRCRGCGQVLPLEQYPLDGRGREGRGPRCVPCKAEAGRDSARRSYHKTRAERPAKVAEIRARQRERLALLNHGEDGLQVHIRRERGDGCDVCGRRTGRMAIDHCHQTGRVRGLLCPRCNLTLGHCEDDPAVLRKLADWIESNRKAELT